MNAAKSHKTKPQVDHFYRVPCKGSTLTLKQISHCACCRLEWDPERNTLLPICNKQISGLINSSLRGAAEH